MSPLNGLSQHPLIYMDFSPDPSSFLPLPGIRSTRAGEDSCRTRCLNSQGFKPEEWELEFGLRLGEKEKSGRNSRREEGGLVVVGWRKKGISAWISCLGWAQHLGIRALLWKWMGRGVGRWDLGDRERVQQELTRPAPGASHTSQIPGCAVLISPRC